MMPVKIPAASANFLAPPPTPLPPYPHLPPYPPTDNRDGVLGRAVRKWIFYSNQPLQAQREERDIFYYAMMAIQIK